MAAARVTPLVLASSSPQRRAILEVLDVRFEVSEPDVEEVGAGEPRAVVVENALRKARSVWARAPDRRVLGVDTTVVLEGRIYGKPRDEAQARRILEGLAGREHRVWGGIALIPPAGRAEATAPSGAEAVNAASGARATTAGSGPESLTAAAMTRVHFRALAPADLDWYLASGEWRGRAGGYAIQSRGAALVERIEGDYSNVVGLPVAALARLAPDLFRA